MSWFGVNGFFIFLITFHIIIGVFALYRMKIRKTKDNPDSTFTPLPITITPVGLKLDPDTPVEPINNSINNSKQTKKFPYTTENDWEFDNYLIGNSYKIDFIAFRL